MISGKPKGHALYEAIEIVCKGWRWSLPAGISFKDKEGKLRHEVRVRWWQRICPLTARRRSAAEEMEKIPDAPIRQNGRCILTQDLRCYSTLLFSGTPQCDFAAGSPVLTTVRHAIGPLVAYRWDEGSTVIVGEADVGVGTLLQPELSAGYVQLNTKGQDKISWPLRLAQQYSSVMSQWTEHLAGKSHEHCFF